MQTMVDVGLGYVRLGHARPPTLSGARRTGQALHRALRRPTATPSTSSTSPHGPALRDVVRGCSRCSGRLVDQGNTVVVIEHNLDVIKTPTG